MSGNINWISGLSRLPRVQLAHLPTPMEYLPRLTRHLGGPSIYVKRDDCTGLAMGGNKTRQLEFLLADALSKGANVVVTHGAVQSNHVRQTAAACARLGLSCAVLLETRVAAEDTEYMQSGNMLLNQLFGAKIVDIVPSGTDMDAAMAAHVSVLLRRGHQPYVIPGGGANALGAIGYVVCAGEILTQQPSGGIGHIVVASGSGGTHAGLVAGLCLGGRAVPVTGISVGTPASEQAERVWALSIAAAQLLDADAMVPGSDIQIDDQYRDGGYGIAGPATCDAVRLIARLEGILSDPVYTGKAVAGLIGMIDRGDLPRNVNVVLMLTGGTPGLFAYRTSLGEYASGERGILG